jgi:hypothetical protein
MITKSYLAKKVAEKGDLYLDADGAAGIIEYINRCGIVTFKSKGHKRIVYPEEFEYFTPIILNWREQNEN